MSAPSADLPTARVMNQAIELAIEERSFYPDRAAFINAEAPNTAEAIIEAFDEDRAAVLVSGDGSVEVLLPPAVRAAQAGMSPGNDHTPAMLVMEEAIDRDLEGRSVYPKRAAFLNAERPEDDKMIKRALDEQ